MENKINHRSILGVLAGVAIPLSTALQNGMLYVLIVLALFDPQIRDNILSSLKVNFVRLSLIIYLLFVIGVSWSHAPHSAIVHMLIKVSWLLLVPFIYACMQNETFRKSFWIGFIGGVLITLLFSYVTFLLHHPVFAGAKYPGNPWCTFRGHVYHCYFVTVFAIIIFWGLLNKFYSTNEKIFAGGLLVLCAVNIIYLSYSRTGVMIFFVAIALLLILWNFKRGLIIGIIALAILIPVSYFTSSSIQNRFHEAQSDVTQYDKGNPSTSVGLRLEFHKNSLELIKKSPIIGYGSGSFAYEYESFTHLTGNRATTNPHNDYYWFGVELGVIGMLALIGLIIAGCYDAMSKCVGLDRALAILILLTYAFIATQWAFFTDNVSGVAFPFFICALLAGQNFVTNKKKVQNLFLL